MGRYSTGSGKKIEAALARSAMKAAARRDRLVAKEEKKLGTAIDFDDGYFVSMARGRFSKSQSEIAAKHDKAVERLNNKGIYR